MAEKEATEKKDMVGIEVSNSNFFKAWTGKRVDRDVRDTTQGYKLTFGLPVPATTEQAQEMYNVSLEDLVERGVKQLSYSADKEINEAVKGADLATVEDTAGFALTFEKNLFITPKERKTAVAKVNAKKASRLDQIASKLGVSAEEFLAMDDKEIAQAMKKALGK